MKEKKILKSRKPDSLYHSGDVKQMYGLSGKDNCIGCDLCASRCPAQAIQIINNSPVWVKDHCVMCAGCINNCPAGIIAFARFSQKLRKTHNG